jgi:hypothetical protein
VLGVRAATSRLARRRRSKKTPAVSRGEYRRRVQGRFETLSAYRSPVPNQEKSLRLFQPRKRLFQPARFGRRGISSVLFEILIIDSGPRMGDRLAARDGAVRLKIVLAEDVRYAPRSSVGAQIFRGRACRTSRRSLSDFAGHYRIVPQSDPQTDRGSATNRGTSKITVGELAAGKPGSTESLDVKLMVSY